MRKIWNKGHRIRASDKHLVYHFSIGMLLVVFVAVLLLLNIKQLMRTDWEHFSLLEKLSYVIRVSAPDLDELKRRCDEVKDFYDDLNVKLVRPAGDMLGLHSEFLPASKRYINDYVQ